MTEASYTAWDGNLYEWPPPDGWYEAADGKWWPQGYGPTPEANGAEDPGHDEAGDLSDLVVEDPEPAPRRSYEEDELPNIDDVFGGINIFEDEDDGYEAPAPEPADHGGGASYEPQPLADLDPAPLADDVPPAHQGTSSYAIEPEPMAPPPTYDETAVAAGAVDDAQVGVGDVAPGADGLAPVVDGDGFGHPPTGRPAGVHPGADVVIGAFDETLAAPPVQAPPPGPGPDGQPGSVFDTMAPDRSPGIEHLGPPPGVDADHHDGFSTRPPVGDQAHPADAAGRPVGFDPGLQDPYSEADRFGPVGDEQTMVLSAAEAEASPVGRVDDYAEGPDGLGDDYDDGGFDEPDRSALLTQGRDYSVADFAPDSSSVEFENPRTVWPLAVGGVCVALLVALLVGYLVFRGGSEPLPDVAAPDIAATGLGSFNEPYEFGTGVVVFYDGVGGERRWVVQVLSPVTNGTDQLAQPRQGEVGETEALAVSRVRITYQSGPAPGLLADLDFNAVGDSLAVYQEAADGCGVVTDALNLAAELEPATSIEGNVCWQITATDLESLRLGVEAGPADGRVHLSLS